MTDIREHILDAAAACFSENGADATSIDDVAEYLGATKGKIYHHFNSKAELLMEVRLRSITLTMESVRPTYLNGGTPVELLYEMANRHVLTILDKHNYHRVMTGAFKGRPESQLSVSERSQLNEINGLRTRHEEMFRAVIELGINDKKFPEQNVSVTLHSLLILLNSPVFWFRDRKDQSDAEREIIAGQIARMGVAAVVYQATC